MALTPSASYSLTLRAAIKNRPGMLGRLTSAIGEAGGDIRAVDLVELVKDIIVRDFTINARDEQHGQEIVAAIRRGRGRPDRERLRPDVPHAPGREDRDPQQGAAQDAGRPLDGVHPGVARVCLAIREARSARSP
jgi:hypothetical protein